MDPSGLRLTVEGDPDDGPDAPVERGVLVGLLNALCPEAGGFTQASGSIQPVNPQFCSDDWMPLSALQCYLFSRGACFKRPGPYATGKHPKSCEK